MILIVAEHANGALSKSAYELVTAARGLKREGGVAALVLGSGVASVAAAAALVADQVLVADTPELAQYDAEIWSAAVAQIATEGDAEVVLIAGSRSGREYSPRVAVKLDAPLQHFPAQPQRTPPASLSQRSPAPELPRAP